MDKGMHILAIDTATPRTVVAVWKDRRALAEYGEASRNHSVTLLPAINRMLTGLGLERSGIGAVAVGIGPGSFTGLRVGLAMAKSMAYAMDVPLVGVSTLTALALNGDMGAENRICAVLDALKNEVYCAVYRAGDGALEEVQAAGAFDPEKLARELAREKSSCQLLGSGALRYRKVFCDVLGGSAIFPEDESLHQIKAGSIGMLGQVRLRSGERDDPMRLEPDYCRLSEAELSRLKKPR